MAGKNRQKDLAHITQSLQAALGEQLESLILYGSTVQGETSEKYSDMNLLCVLRESNAANLDAAAPALAWWARQEYPPVNLLSVEEQRDSSDVFPLEYLDIHHQHQVLAGKDCFAEVPAHPQLHRLQVEHDLRTQLMRLRSGYALAGSDSRKLEKLLLGSLITFLVLFRHALLAEGEGLTLRLADIIDAAARRFRIDAEPWRRLLDARRDGAKLEKGALKQTFSLYLRDIQRVERAMEGAGQAAR